MCRKTLGPVLAMALTLWLLPVAAAADVASNGNGGGSWSEVETWRAKALPAKTDAVTITSGDKVVFDLQSKAPAYTSIKVAKDSVLEVKGTLIMAGTMTVDGTLRLLPGSSAQMACAKNAEFGIEVGEGGRMIANKSTITAFTRDGKHNGLIAIGGKYGKALGEFVECEISYMGGHRKVRERKRRGILFWRSKGAKVVGCKVHHCTVMAFVLGSNGQVKNNEIHGNVTGLSLFQIRGFDVSGNDLHDNRLTGMYIHVDVVRYENTIADNRVHGNRVGVYATSLGKTPLKGNTCYGNKTGLFLGAFQQHFTNYVENGRFYANGKGAEIGARTRDARLYAFQSCVFGENEKGEPAPNTEADIWLPTVKKKGTVGVEVVMDNCKLLSPTPVANVLKGDTVTSTNHNQQKGEEKNWTVK